MRWPAKDSTWTRRIQFWRARGKALARSSRQRGGDPRPMVPLASQSAPPPAATSLTPVDQAWDEAFVRVESYLRAHHLSSRIQLNALANQILTEARVLAAERPHEEPVELAMHVLQLKLGAWFVRAFNEGDWADERFRARGRLALVLTGMSTQWPGHFLANEEMPNAITAALKNSVLQPGPEIRFSNMPPAPLEFPFDDAEKPAWRTFNEWPFLKGLATWVFIISLLGVAWMKTR